MNLFANSFFGYFCKKLTQMSLKNNLLLTLGLCLMIVPTASAYLDPGTGSYIVQILVAGALGGIYAIKMYWMRVVNFFKGSSASDESSEEFENE